MDWSAKVNYFEKNPVTVARQIDYVFKKLLGKVFLSGMHLIDQILNFDDWRGSRIEELSIRMLQLIQ